MFRVISSFMTNAPATIDNWRKRETPTVYVLITTYFLEASLKERRTFHCIAPPPWTFASVDATVPYSCETSSDSRGWCCNNCKGILAPPPQGRGRVSGGSRGRRGNPGKATGNSGSLPTQNPSQQTSQQLTWHSLTGSLEKNPLNPDIGRKDQTTFLN